ncbi:glycosyl hydrolase family 26 [Rathayibacter sp. PhB185]|nr:glycosyl hydrolase family 26 [Rathayibacter sp. PhB186]ROS51784.1 glycosyl hydrolase family 26 [Rathayibacter sp. PhB185]
MRGTVPQYRAAPARGPSSGRGRTRGPAAGIPCPEVVVLDRPVRQLLCRGFPPIATAERGKVPDASLLQSRTRWSYFMIWSEQLRGSNTNAAIQSAYFHPRVLNQGELTLP